MLRTLSFPLAAAVLALSVGACDVVEGRQTAAQYTDDTAISTEVRTRILADETAALGNVNVTTLNREVQLSGFAATEEERQRAEQIARNVDGVARVHNDVVVRP